MEKELFKIAKSGNQEEIQNELQSFELSQVFRILRSEAMKQNIDIILILKAIFHGIANKENEFSKHRLDAYKFAVSLLQKNDLSSQMASELVGVLLLETDAFPSSDLADLANSLVDCIKNSSTHFGKWLEILPKVLTTISARDIINYNGNSMSGAEYKSDIINSICSSRWELKSAIPLATMFRDIPLTSKELNFVVQKLLKLLIEMEIQEIPPLVYQLLLLAAQGSRKQVLLGMMKFFNEQDSRFSDNIMEISMDSEEVKKAPYNKESVLHTEGTVLLYITYAAKQDQDLGKEFLKLLKSHQHQPNYILTPFTLGLALSLTKIQRFEEQIMELLKSTIIRHYRENEKKHQSSWIREMLPKNDDISSLILATVEHSKYGWDHVTQGLVHFSFALLDCLDSRSAFGRSAYVGKCSMSPSDCACSLGGRILQETFKTHTVVRSEILEQILNRVITKTSKPVFHYIEALAQTICSAPQLFLDSLTKLKEVLDYLPFLPHSSAVGLIRALTPLLKICPSLKDNFILVLRKALFNRELETRKIAVSGFLVILRNFKILGGLPLSQTQNCPESSISMSQVQIDIHSFKSVATETVCLELLGTLKRVLVQQSDVKYLLYEGLFEALFKNPQLSNAILELLASQFQKYYENADDAKAPFKLNNCVKTQGDQTCLIEPLANLISTIQMCVAAIFKKHGCGDAEEEDDLGFRRGSYIMLKTAMDNLVKKMILSELEDFEMDSSAEYNSSTTIGQKNHLLASLLLGIYESLIEYSFMIGDFSLESCQDVISLYTKYQNLMDILQDKTSNGSKKGETKGRKGIGTSKSLGIKSFASLLSLKFLTALLDALFCDKFPNHHEGLTLLRGHQDFVHYIVTVCNYKIGKLQEVNRCEGSRSDKLFIYISSIGRALLKQYIVASDSSPQNQNEKTSLLILECFSQLLHWISSSFQHDLNTFLSSLEKSDSVNDDGGEFHEQEHLIEKIKLFQRLVLKLLSDTQHDHSLKEVIPLLSIISTLSKQLHLGSEAQQNVHGWAKQLCTQQALEDVGVTKALLQLCLILSHQGKVCVTLLRDLAFDVHYHLGDIDEETEVRGTTTFGIVNQRTAVNVSTLVLQHMEQILDEVDWIMNCMKSEINIIALTSSESDCTSLQGYDKKQEEHSICTRLGHLITAFHEVVQTALPSGPCVENSLKLLVHLYNSLTNFTKYALALYAQKVGHLSSWFEKLVKLSGRHLTPQVYTLITYIQASEDSLHNYSDKKKNKRDSVAEKAKVLREAKTLPPLIFAIEQYERHLIQLSKKSKVNLMVHFKLSTSRDFRINTATVEAVLDKQSDSEAEKKDCEAENANPDQIHDETPLDRPYEIQNEVTKAEEPPAKKKKMDRCSKLRTRK